MFKNIIEGVLQDEQLKDYKKEQAESEIKAHKTAVLSEVILCVLMIIFSDGSITLIQYTSSLMLSYLPLYFICLLFYPPRITFLAHRQAK